MRSQDGAAIYREGSSQPLIVSDPGMWCLNLPVLSSSSSSCSFGRSIVERKFECLSFL